MEATFPAEKQKKPKRRRSEESKGDTTTSSERKERKKEKKKKRDRKRSVVPNEDDGSTKLGRENTGFAVDSGKVEDEWNIATARDESGERIRPLTGHTNGETATKDGEPSKFDVNDNVQESQIKQGSKDQTSAEGKTGETLRRRATLTEIGGSFEEEEMMDKDESRPAGSAEFMEAVQEESQDGGTGGKGEDDASARPEGLEMTEMVREEPATELLADHGEQQTAPPPGQLDVSTSPPGQLGTLNAGFHGDETSSAGTTRDSAGREGSETVSEEPLTDVVVVSAENMRGEDGQLREERVDVAAADDSVVAVVEGTDENAVSEQQKTPKMVEINGDDELPWAMYRSLDPAYMKLSSVENEEQDWEPLDEGDTLEGENEKNLPDLYALLESLEEDKQNLLNSRSMTNLGLFESDKQQAQYKYIDDLKLQMVDSTINQYIEDFHQNVEDEILMIGSISLEDVQEEEKRLREEHILYQQQQSLVQRNRQEDILVREELAKRNVMLRLKERRKALMRREEHLMQKDRLLQNKIHQAFRRSEHQLLKALEARKAEVKTMYGELVMADGEYGGSKGRRWKVDWNRSPQPIQIKLKCLRGIKDKLPAGRYVLMASLYDRLGGHVMKWSNLKGQQWGGATLPLFHEGEFYNIELKIDQSVFTVCPPRPDIRPGMVLVFELFLLRGAVTPTDRVVGWGCFPVCDSNFRVVEGKYKTPFLRGDIDSGIDTYQRIEQLMADDIDNWMCNLYFDVVLLPRYMAGQKEYEVELQFTSNLLGHPDRTRETGEQLVDGDEPVFGSQLDVQSQASSRKNSKASSILDRASSASEAKESGEGDADQDKTLSNGKDLELPSTRVKTPSVASLQSIDEKVVRPSTVIHASRKVTENTHVLDGLSEESGSDISDEELAEMRKQEEFQPVKGKPGMFYKKHLNNPVDTYHNKLFTMLPKTPLLNRRKRKRKMTHLEELEQHTYSVKSRWSNKGRIPHRGTEKMQYIGRQFLSELGLSQWRSREFWAMILMLILTWFIRIYAHYGGQWIYLSAILVPISRFQFLPYTTNLNYQSTLLQTRQEISLVVLGPFTNIIIFSVMVFLSWLIQTLFGRFSNIVSRFVMAYGINALLDPVWILIVDTALQRYEFLGGDFPVGDAYKLYWHFDRYEKNGIIGIFITVFLYIVTVFTTSTILYMYFLRVHNSGRLLDIYHRLNAMEDKFFVPYDLEVSLEELTYISRKAEQWRGEEGERRKVAVYDYVWEEQELDDKIWDKKSRRGKKKKSSREVTSHVSIHTIYLDGLRELYRHFLRLPDGAIVEVFGEMPITGVDETVKQAIMHRNTYDNMQAAAGGSTTTSLRSRPCSSKTFGSRRQSKVQFSDQTPQTLDVPSTSHDMHHTLPI